MGKTNSLVQLEPKIIFENDDFIVINKPAGLVVHADGRTDEITLTDWILSHFPDLKEVGEPWVRPQGQNLSLGEKNELKDDQNQIIYRPGIVHRLDRETSGLMLIAKTQNYFELLKKQFQQHQIHKTYLAFVYGEIKAEEGKIDKAIGRSSQDFRRWSAGRGARGVLREAITNFKTLWRSKEVSFLELKPETGRTHQLRVHLKYFNHPIVADKLYAPNQPVILNFNRTALHAWRIDFIDESSGQKFEFEAPLPKDFIQAKKELGIK